MDLRLLTLLACCAFMVELGVQCVGGSVYVKGGSRYPFPRPQQSNTDAAAVHKNPSSSNKQPSRAYYIDSNKRVQRDVLNSEIVTGGTEASIPLPATSLATAGNDQTHKITQITFEDQHPIDFDLNVRPMVHFIPGLKSVKN